MSRWEELVGSKNKPVEIYIDETLAVENVEDNVKLRTLKAAFRGLQVGFGFGLGMHNLLASDYADILMNLEPRPLDAKSRLTTTTSPVELENNYLGLKTEAELVRLMDRSREHDCDALESIIVAHQHILSMVCSEGGIRDAVVEENGQRDGSKSAEQALTWSFCRYSVIIPPFSGMQDFLRMVDAPADSVSVECTRSALYSNDEVYPSPGKSLESYCWRNTTMSETGPRNTALYKIYTLFPSKTGGLIPENIEKLGIYLTVTEEIIRGHTGNKGTKGKYYEWVSPVIAEVKRRRVRTFYLGVGCSIVLPSTFVVRLGAHCSEEVVVFVHAVRVKVPNPENVIFMRRPPSSIPRDLHEYGNVTELLQTSFTTGKDRLRFDDPNDSEDEVEQCVLGTIPSMVNVPLHAKVREKLVEHAYDVRVGREGIGGAYHRTPVITQEIEPLDGTPGCDEEDGVLRTRQPATVRYLVDDVPYDYLAYIAGKDFQFPISLGTILTNHRKSGGSTSDEEKYSMSDEDSTSDTEESTDEHSDIEESGNRREPSESDSERSA